MTDPQPERFGADFRLLFDALVAAEKYIAVADKTVPATNTLRIVRAAIEKAENK